MLLHGQHDVVDREVGPAQPSHAPVFPVRRAEELVELRRELIGLGAEHLLLEELEGLALFLGLDDDKRRLRVGIALVIAVDVDAADVPGDEAHDAGVLAQQDAETPCGPGRILRPARRPDRPASAATG